MKSAVNIGADNMAERHAFASDLSGQEFWLVVDKGYIPVGMVPNVSEGGTRRPEIG
jgi:hypothetical protein